MAGPSVRIRLYTDENIFPELAAALRREGFDALSAAEASQSGTAVPDIEQLQFASSQGRAILTYDVADFATLDSVLKEKGEEHAGILVSPPLHDFRVLLQRVRHHLMTVDPVLQRNCVLWLRSA